MSRGIHPSRAFGGFPNLEALVIEASNAEEIDDEHFYTYGGEYEKSVEHLCYLFLDSKLQRRNIFDSLTYYSRYSHRPEEGWRVFRCATADSLTRIIPCSTSENLRSEIIDTDILSWANNKVKKKVSKGKPNFKHDAIPL
ncbi:hypothetical protein AAHE18_02G091000 [Arachis hypogaea]